MLSSSNVYLQDEQIRGYVKEILDKANLEEITMKTVCKQVYAKYPDFDLTDKKDFIKATVKAVSYKHIYNFCFTETQFISQFLVNCDIKRRVDKSTLKSKKGPGSVHIQHKTGDSKVRTLYADAERSWAWFAKCNSK